MGVCRERGWCYVAAVTAYEYGAWETCSGDQRETYRERSADSMFEPQTVTVE